MLYLGTRGLARIMLVGALLAAAPGMSFAADSCVAGSVALGQFKASSYVLDSAEMAQFTLDSTALDLALVVKDDQENVACESSTTVSGHLACSWMPDSGVTYSVQVLRPATDAQLADTGLSTDTEDYNLCEVHVN